MTEASAKTAKPADADKRRYYTRTKDRVSEQKKDNADGCSRTVPHISLGDDVPTKGSSRAPCGGGTQRYAAYQIVRQFGCVRGLRLRGGKGVASTKGEPVAPFWAATESTPTETTDATQLEKTESRYDRRKSTAYLANTVLREQRNGGLNNNTRVSNKVVAHNKGSHVALLATGPTPWNESISATYNDRVQRPGTLRRKQTRSSMRIAIKNPDDMQLKPVKDPWNTLMQLNISGHTRGHHKETSTRTNDAAKEAKKGKLR